MRSQRKRSRSAWTQLLLALSLLLALTVPALAEPNRGDSALPCSEIVRDPDSGLPQLLRNCQSPDLPNPSPEAIANAFLAENHLKFAMPADLGGLQLLSVDFGLHSSHVRFQQTYAELPVYGVYTSVHMDQNLQIQVIHNGYRPGLAVDLNGATITADQAAALARQAINFVSPRGESPLPQRVILPLAGTSGRLVWRVMILAAEPQGDWEVLIDATTGEALKRYNRLVLARGQVFDPNPAQQSGRSDRDNPAWPELTQVDLPGLDGSGWLRGDYVDVTRPSGAVPAAAFQPDGDFLYGPDDPRFEEVMVYYHIDATQRYVQSLGYSDANLPANGIRDWPTEASAHWFAQDQSFYSVSDDALHFGDGGVQDGEDADIIVHEYAHALQHDQVACWGGGEMDAIGEGFGDYLAASRFAAVGDDPACIAEWDSISYAPGPDHCLRRVDRDRMYPQGVTGDPHVDGEIWSRALWDLRTALGATVADTLAIESNFYLPCGATMLEAGQALLDADANAYDGVHAARIGSVLVERGLADLPAPTILSPSGGETLFPGNLTTISWRPNHSWGASYELQVSANADRVSNRRDAFNNGRLPDDYATYGNMAWRLDGGATRSGAITHNGSSSLILPVRLARAGDFSFRYRVSSEPGWDMFEVLVDGMQALQASGEAGWTTFSTRLEAGAHEIVWRYRKDSTISGREDAVWIDDVSLDNVSGAVWQPAEVVSRDPAAGRMIWRTPDMDSSAVQVRMRARLDGSTSPWATSYGLFVIGEPAAVTLSNFAAGSGGIPRGHLRLWPWGALALIGAAGLGVWLERRIWLLRLKH